MMSKLLVYSILSLFVSCCISCSDGDEDCFTPPPEFFADIRDGDGRSILPQYEAEDISLYYLDDGNQTFNVDFSINGFFISGELPFLSISGETLFYLEIDDVVDTLVVEILEDQSSDNNCGYFYNYVGFNGEPAELDTTGQRGIYVLTKE